MKHSALWHGALALVAVALAAFAGVGPLWP